MGKTILLSIVTAMLFSCNSGEKGSVYKNVEGEELLTIELSGNGQSIVNIWYQNSKDGEKEKGVIEKQDFMEGESDSEPVLIMADVKINSLGGNPVLVSVSGDKTSIISEDDKKMKFELQK